MAHDGADVTLGQGILLDDLMSLTGAAIAPAEEVLEKAKQAVRATVVEDGRVSGKLIEANQFAAHGLAWLGVLSALETIILPIPIELIMVPYMLARPQRIWLIAGVTLLGCVVGSLIGYTVGFFLFDSIGQPLLEWMNAQDAYDSFISKQPGFIAAGLHVNDAQTRIANYSQWTRREDFQAMLRSDEMRAVSMERAVSQLSVSLGYSGRGPSAPMYKRGG